MKITIFGAGAVGGHLAARLVHSGTPVSVVARGPHLDAIRARGLTIHAGDKVFTGQPKATDQAQTLGTQDLVVVAIKCTGLSAAIKDIKPLIGPETRVVFAMNGLPWWFLQGLPVRPTLELQRDLNPDGSFGQLVSLERSVAGVITSGGAIVGPGVIRNTTPQMNILILGFADGREDPIVSAFAELVNRAGYKTSISKNIRKDIWAKLLVNAASAMVATAADRNSQQAVSDPEMRTVIIACMNEIIAIGKSIGVAVDNDPVAMTDPARSAPHRSSFLQDLDAGRPLELASTILAARDIGRANGVPAPHLTTVAALIAARSADRTALNK